MTAPPAPPSHHSSFYTSFPILAISILGILTTAVLLLSYYIFVIKCCLNWRRPHLLLFRISSTSRSRRFPHLHPTPHPPQGLDATTINSIPTLRFSKQQQHTSSDCAVCLADFRDGELLRLLPNCSHAFHIDCVDTWLHSHITCPLCRSSVTPLSLHLFSPPPHSLPPPPPPPQQQQQQQQSHGEVRIEIGGGDAADEEKKTRKRFWNVGKSMGDEFIDIGCRVKDERFVVQQPIRRSFSMDSSNDRQLYLSVQKVLRQNPNLFLEPNATTSSNASYGNGRIRRSFFSFGRSMWSASVLPVQTEDL